MTHKEIEEFLNQFTEKENFDISDLVVLNKTTDKKGNIFFVFNKKITISEFEMFLIQENILNERNKLNPAWYEDGYELHSCANHSGYESWEARFKPHNWD